MQARAQELEATGLVRAWRAGGESARAALVERVHANVRALVAQAQRSFPGMAGEATAAAPEAVHRMLDAHPACADRPDFFRATAQATRQVLVAAARRVADPRGTAPIERARVHIASAGADADPLRIEATLHDLQRTDARRAEAGIDQDLRLARAWLDSVPTA
ncbi:MAG: hypothetical protein DWB45_11295 [Xanthomonadales bacterium]|nr:hypothetical protein [Xanthomonadales bacterium]MDL1869999.1 hypothetical protein [Gammaproteobacteria bacterium PRO6]